MSDANIVSTKSLWCSLYKVLGVSFTSLVSTGNLLEGVNNSFDPSNQLAGSTSEALDLSPKYCIRGGKFCVRTMLEFFAPRKRFGTSLDG